MYALCKKRATGLTAESVFIMNIPFWSAVNCMNMSDISLAFVIIWCLNELWTLQSKAGKWSQNSMIDIGFWH